MTILSVLLPVLYISQTKIAAATNEQVYISIIDEIKESVDFFYSDNNFVENEIRFILHDQKYKNALINGADGGIWHLNEESFNKTKHRKSFQQYYQSLR